MNFLRSSIIIFVSIISIQAQAVASPESNLELKSPQQLTLYNGAPLEGYARGRVDENGLVFVVPLTVGEAEYTYDARQIKSLRFTDEVNIEQIESLLSLERRDDALALIEQIYLPRAAYLDLLSEQDRKTLCELVPLARHAGDPYLAVGMARRLLMAVEGEAHTSALRDQILLAYLDLPLPDETRKLAQAWIAREPHYGPSALGWVVLAQLEIEVGNWQAALDIALEPIVFSSQYPMEYLHDAYDMAILAAETLGDTPQAEALTDELEARGLPTPEDRKAGHAHE